MEEPVKATFWHIGEVVYRNKTKIIFNKDDEIEENLPCIGIVLMLNPGSCLPKEGKECILKLPERKEREFPCNKDITIKKVVECVTESYNNNLQGCVYIVNLSDKSKTKSEKLSEEDFTKEALEIIKEIEDKIKEQEENGNSINWIWIAFGKIYDDNKCPNKHKKRNELKKRVVNRLKDMFSGKILGEKINYLHPFNFNFKNKYNDEKLEIIKEIKPKLENSQ